MESMKPGQERSEFRYQLQQLNSSKFKLTWYSAAIASLSSTFILAKSTLSLVPPTILSILGASSLHGPHHCAILIGLNQS